MHAGGVETWKKSKYEYRDQLEVRFLTLKDQMANPHPNLWNYGTVGNEFKSKYYLPGK